MNLSDRNHFSRKSDPTYRNKKSKEVPSSDNMDSVQNIKRKGASLARPELNRQNSLGINNQECSSKRISVFESRKSDILNHSGGTKIMNFIKSSLNLAKSKSKSKLNISDNPQIFYNQNISSKSDDHLNVVADDNSYQFVKSNNLVLKTKDNTLYVKEYNEDINLKTLIVLDNQCLIQPLHPSLTNHHNFCFQIIKKPKIDSSRQCFSINAGNAQTSQIAKSISYNSSFSSIKHETIDSDSITTIRCSTISEMNEWITKIKKHINPNYENSVRNEDLLQIWIQEAKQLIPKKRYYCEIKLDGVLYGRTTIKMMTDMVFWGEEFEFRNLQNISEIKICLYKMTDNKKKLEKSELVAQIEVPCSELTDSTFTEKWYSPSFGNPINTRLSQSIFSNTQKNELEELLKNAVDIAPMIRIKGRYKPLEILPNQFYESLSTFLVKFSIPLVESLESHLKVKSKEDFVKILLVILKNKNSQIDFLADLVTMEVSKAEDNLILRGNSIASKAMEYYLKMVGEKYLTSLLKDLIKEVIFEEIDCEVDPLRLSNTKETSQIIETNRNKLLRLVENIWSKICNSAHLIPNDLKLVFSKIREKLLETKRVSSFTMIYQVISSCLFLRFICPAIMSPFLFGLSNEYPDNNCINRTFTLIAKSIQSLANFSQFPQSKETYMEFMQNFINKNSSSMCSFLKNISTNNSNEIKSIETRNILNLKIDDNNNSPTKDDQYIDIGYHLAELMFQLNIHLKDIPEKEYTPILNNLRTIIENISKSSIHNESDTDSGSSNISNFNNIPSRIPMLISKIDKTNNKCNKSVFRVQSQNSNRPLSLLKQKSEIEENFSYIPTREIENKEPSIDERKVQLNNDNYVDFEHFEDNPIYDEPCQDFSVTKSPYGTRYLNEEEIHEDWYKIVKESNNASINSNNSLLEDSCNYTLNSSGYQTLANISPDNFEKSVVQTQNSYDYLQTENSNSALASSLPVKLSSSKNSPIHQKLAYKRIKKGSPLIKKTSYCSTNLKNSNSNNIINQSTIDNMANVFSASHETLASSDNLSETENHKISQSKSFQICHQKNSGSNNNLLFLHHEPSISASPDSILSSKIKLKSQSSKSIENIISTNIDLDPLISNEWKRIKLLLKLFDVPKPNLYQGSAIEQYKQRTTDENCLEEFLKKQLQFNTLDIINYLPAAYRLLKSVHKTEKLSTALLTQYLMHGNHRVQVRFMNQHLTEIISETNGPKSSSSKKSRNTKAHREDISNLSTHSLPFPINKYSK